MPVVYQKMIHYSGLLFLILFGIAFNGCTTTNEVNESNDDDVQTDDLYFFDEVKATQDSYESIIIPEGFSYEIIFSEGDSVQLIDGSFAAAKGMQDCILFLEQQEQLGHLLFVGHETTGYFVGQQHGGGASLLVLKQGENGFETGVAKDIDFTTVGGTARNCGGSLSPMGTILSAEETCPRNNEKLFDHYPDSSDFNNEKRFKNFGFMVEINPFERKAVRKLKDMGRFSHEDALCMPDKKTVYLTQDESPCAFYKFVADSVGDYSSGTLSAFNEIEGWIELPKSEKFYASTFEVAIEKGATLYNRHEWITISNGLIYISETGKDDFDWNKAIAWGGVPASHFGYMAKDEPGRYKDPYGRILVFDPVTLKMDVYLEGGTDPKNDKTNLASPDCVEAMNIQGNDYLIINEDLIGTSKNRVPKRAKKEGFGVNEIYFNLIQEGGSSVSESRRFLIAPKGAETSGSFYSDKLKTLFVSIQHPDRNNPAPFNKSCVIAIRGF